MHEVTYKIALRDWRQGFKVGLSHMTPPYRVFWSCLALFMTVGLVLVALIAEYATKGFPTPLLSRFNLLAAAVLIGAALAAYALDIAVVGYLSRLLPVTVEILPLHLAYKCGFLSNRIRWKDVTAILDAGEHVCFCQNFPSATVVPKSAFPNQEQVRAFLEQADHYWRRETGRRDIAPPDVSGVWPPAPRAGDSQELGQPPKG